MKLDRRKCRKYADRNLKIPKSNGLLYAEQIKYIIRTAVKIIDHHRVLVLYVYSQEEAVEGDFRPKFTVFQGKDDFVTLARKEDGTAAWRVSAFDDLGAGWPFRKECAFFTPKDEERIQGFFREKEKKGLHLLARVQSGIQQQKRMERQRLRERRVMERMEVLPPLPQGIGEWVHYNVMPAYFFYDYKKGRKMVKGTCSSCGKEVEIAGARHNRKAACPGCGREVTMKARGRRGYLHDHKTCQVLQKTGPNEVAIRIVKCYYTYKPDDIPEKIICENARLFVKKQDAGGILCETYYKSYGGLLTNWRHGVRPVFCHWQYNFEADQCGHVYCGNLPKELEGTPWQYCPVKAYYGHYPEEMEMEPFLSAYLEHPKFEHLIKTGFFRLATGLAYSRYQSCELDETQDRTHRLLGVMAEDVPFLRSLDPDMDILKTFQEYCQRNLKDRQKLLLWQRENKVERDVLKILAHITPHRLMRYLDSQYSFLSLRKTKYGAQRYSSMQDLVSEYRDYLEMCVKQKYDMRNSFVLYPKDLQKSHDKVAHRIKMKADAKMRRDFKKAYHDIAGQMDFEMDGMKILYPATPDEIISEGNTLHHCVGGYVDRVARKECVILFLRQCADESKSFYTIEVREREVVQVRGMKNDPPTPKVKKFMEQWKKRVLAVPAMQQAA